MAELIARIQRQLWIAAYVVEESRERHTIHRRYVRSALCCLGLTVLQLLGRGL